MQKKIQQKLHQLTLDPFDVRLSKPLQQTDRRSARVGDYRILFTVEAETLKVVEIGPRGQIYRTI